jgi:hypothetical protein
MVTTPSQLQIIGRNTPIAPKLLVIDEADLMFQNDIYRETVVKAVAQL